MNFVESYKNDRDKEIYNKKPSVNGERNKVRNKRGERKDRTDARKQTKSKQERLITRTNIIFLVYSCTIFDRTKIIVIFPEVQKYFSYFCAFFHQGGTCEPQALFFSMFQKNQSSQNCNEIIVISQALAEFTKNIRWTR